MKEDWKEILPGLYERASVAVLKEVSVGF